MNESRKQAGQHIIIRVSRIKTTHYTNDGRNLFNQPPEKASYQTVPQNNYYQYVERIHSLVPWLSPVGAGIWIERINGLK